MKKTFLFVPVCFSFLHLILSENSCTSSYHLEKDMYLLSLCNLLCFVALGSCVVVFDCWGEAFFPFKINLHYSVLTASQERCSSDIIFFIWCSVIPSFHMHFLQIHLSFSLSCLSNVLLLFLESFLIYFTYRLSKFPKLRCKHVPNSEGNLV